MRSGNSRMQGTSDFESYRSDISLGLLVIIGPGVVRLLLRNVLQAIWTGVQIKAQRRSPAKTLT